MQRHCAQYVKRDLHEPTGNGGDEKRTALQAFRQLVRCRETVQVSRDADKLRAPPRKSPSSYELDADRWLTTSAFRELAR